MNQRGQMFASYRMLIGFIFAFAMLLIILGTLDYFRGVSVSISNDRVYGAARDAISTPNGDVVLERDLLFNPISYTSRSFENNTGLAAECFTLTARTGTTSFSRESDAQITIHDSLTTDLYVKCETAFGDECEIECTVSFGQALR